MLRLDPSTSTFTSTHVLLLRLCLMARDFQSALPILDNIIFNFPMTKSSEVDEPYPCADHRDSAGYITIESDLTGVINAATVHEYYILGALVYIGLHMWEEAQLFLELVLVSPNQSVANGFMLEAYRKWVLVSCIITGRVSTLFADWERQVTNKR
jgi:COP9 signalosome complex subunit 3